MNATSGLSLIHNFLHFTFISLSFYLSRARLYWFLCCILTFFVNFSIVNFCVGCFNFFYFKLLRCFHFLNLYFHFIFFIILLNCSSESYIFHLCPLAVSSAILRSWISVNFRLSMRVCVCVKHFCGRLSDKIVICRVSQQQHITTTSRPLSVFFLPSYTAAAASGAYIC